MAKRQSIEANSAAYGVAETPKQILLYKG